VTVEATDDSIFSIENLIGRTTATSLILGKQFNS
jgi:hypothetical protein